MRPLDVYRKCTLYRPACLQVHPEDPGYNLRPEHIESTYLLYAVTQVRGGCRRGRSVCVGRLLACRHAPVPVPGYAPRAPRVRGSSVKPKKPTPSERMHSLRPACCCSHLAPVCTCAALW